MEMPPVLTANTSTDSAGTLTIQSFHGEARRRTSRRRRLAVRLLVLERPQDVQLGRPPRREDGGEDPDDDRDDREGHELADWNGDLHVELRERLGHEEREE